MELSRKPAPFEIGDAGVGGLSLSDMPYPRAGQTGRRAFQPTSCRGSSSSWDTEPPGRALCGQPADDFAADEPTPTGHHDSLLLWERCTTSDGLRVRNSEPGAASFPGAILHYAASMSAPATLVMWFQLRSPELAEDFERR